jgi:phosphatidate cytidylyltransferase
VSAPDHRGGRNGRHLPSGGGGANNLATRIASALVLAPIVLFATYAGGWIFLCLWTIAAGGILWEWTYLVARRGEPRILIPGLAALLATAVLSGRALPNAAFAAIATGAGLVGLIVAVPPLGSCDRQAGAWASAGVIYSGAILLGPPLLRRDPDWGLTALLFLFATVWATDVFAFFCGRTIGGPLLWRRVSPRKTWTGAIGGLAGGVAAGVGVAYASGVGKLGVVGGMAFLLSAVAQAGDLVESAVKRHFGAKDASRLIPGHGGLMDRLDGFLVAAAVALLIGLVRKGTAAPASGLLLW